MPLNALALGIPAYYLGSQGLLTSKGPGLIAMYMLTLASSSFIFSIAFYILAVRPLSDIKNLMGNLCRTVSAHPKVEYSGGEIAVLKEGLLCIARQWEESRLKLQEANNEEIRKMEKLA
ncbi:hypothetical protein ACFL4R_02105, partial [Nitrospirota bacterium]